MDKIKNNHYPLVEHLTYVKDHVKDFTQNRRQAFQEKVETLLAFMKDKNAMALLFFNSDVVDRFSFESLNSQNKGTTLIGMSSRKSKLLKVLEEIKETNGKEFRKFLSKCRCFDSLVEAQAFVGSGNSDKVCVDLRMYESSSYVVYNRVILEESGLVNSKSQTPQFTGISNMISQYVNKLIDQVNLKMPASEINVFNALDPMRWSKRDRGRYLYPNIREVATLFHMDPTVIAKQFGELVIRLYSNFEWFIRHRLSDPIYFWSNVLAVYKPPDELTSLVKKVMAVPLGKIFLLISLSGLTFSNSNIIHLVYICMFQHCMHKCKNVPSYFAGSADAERFLKLAIPVF